MNTVSKRSKTAFAILMLTPISLAISPGLVVAQNSSQDRPKTCNDLADNRGLKGQDRRCSYPYERIIGN